MVQTVVDDGAPCICVEPIPMLMRSVRFSRSDLGELNAQRVIEMTNEEYAETRKAIADTDFDQLPPVITLGSLRISRLGGAFGERVYSLTRHDRPTRAFTADEQALRGLFAGIRRNQRYASFSRASAGNLVVNDMTAIGMGYRLQSAGSSVTIELTAGEYRWFFSGLAELDLDVAESFEHVCVLFLASRYNGTHVILRADGTSPIIAVSSSSLKMLWNDARRAKRFGNLVPSGH